MTVEQSAALGAARAAPDDPQAFADWVTPHLGLLSALATRLVDEADADDVVQETLVRAWQRRSTFSVDRGTPRAWLVAVLYDRARRHRTRAKHEAGTPAATPAPADVERLDVERAVAALPRRQREVVTLHYLADLAVDDVAAVLGISAGSVKSALHDARRALRDSLEET